MESYEAFREIIDKYVVANGVAVGHYPFEKKRTFRLYLSLFIWYSFGLTTIITIFTSERETAILCIFFCLFVTQVKVIIFR